MTSLDGTPRIAQVVPQQPGRDAITQLTPRRRRVGFFACARTLIQGKPSVSWGRKATGLDVRAPVSRVADEAAKEA
jgi:hypothetical protein